MTSCTETAMTSALASMDLTAAQGHIMGYLAKCSQPPCSRDIEAAFHLSHPTVSGLLSRLEKKGFIEFRPDETDRRCKRIYVLPKGKQLHETMHRTITENEARLVEGFTPEEQALFASLLLRAISNMGATNYIRKFKEESDE
ncbi:MAG: MarR family winged helix-turn-helix transcriptional regulator [Faecousia sp.]